MLGCSVLWLGLLHSDKLFLGLSPTVSLKLSGCHSKYKKFDVFLGSAGFGSLLWVFRCELGPPGANVTAQRRLHKIWTLSAHTIKLCQLFVYCPAEMGNIWRIADCDTLELGTLPSDQTWVLRWLEVFEECDAGDPDVCSLCLYSCVAPQFVQLHSLLSNDQLQYLHITHWQLQIIKIDILTLYFPANFVGKILNSLNTVVHCTWHIKILMFVKTVFYKVTNNPQFRKYIQYYGGIQYGYRTKMTSTNYTIEVLIKTAPQKTCKMTRLANWNNIFELSH